MVNPTDEPEYNPLDYQNLTLNCVRELMSRGPYALPLAHRFPGAGVYALFYQGDFPAYDSVRSSDASMPIYVGKAVPAGGRVGISQGTITTGRPLYGRLEEHARSIDNATNLRIQDFLCRYLVVTPLWINMAERFLLEHYRPIWNVYLDGFGNHDPGSGRYQGEVSWWDTLHPGRPWAARLRQVRTVAMAEERLRASLAGPSIKPIPIGPEE